VLYVELVGFDLIPMGIRLKRLQVGITTKTSIDPKDAPLGIDEPFDVKMMLQIPQTVFAQYIRMNKIPNTFCIPI
jgi:hypothetical protein